MRVPLSWLGDFAPFPADPRDRSSVTALGEVMDDLGLVVEGISWVGEGLGEVVVARVVDIAAIAGADRIRRVVVDAGGEPVEVVCGAWNFQVGDLVPLARVGAVLPGGFTIANRKMRGAVSNGMLCSGRELGLSDDAEGILVLGGAAEDGPGPGQPLAEALGVGLDAVYDLAIETNRPDAMCVAGVARDLAGRLGLPFAIPEPPASGRPGLSRPPGSSGPGSSGPLAGAPVPGAPVASLAVDAPDLCPRLVGQVLAGVQVTASPRWLARRLTLAGMRPINSVVDASNYVMLELGQPTHPYDLDRLAGHGLSVRRARPGERLVTLDGVERVLGIDRRRGTPADDCLICDANGDPVGIAGVMGGASSEIAPTTSRVLLEAAWFTPMAIARTARRLGLRTEASSRFERGCDPEGIDRAVDRFCQLVAGSGASAGERLRAGAPIPPPPRLRLRTARVNALLGLDLSDQEVRDYLEPIGFATRPIQAGVAEVAVPSWRPDSSREIDLVEEVARHHGYSAIPRTRPASPRVGGLSAYQRERRQVRAVLAGLGASEAWTSSLLAPEDHPRLGLGGPSLELENPLAREESVLRRTLLVGLLGALAANAAHRDADVRLFEIGHVFEPPAPGSELPEEVEVAGLAMAWPGDDARSAVLAWRALVEALRLAQVSLVAAAPPGLHPARSARLVGAGPGPDLGVIGEVDPEVLARFDLAGRRVAWMEIDLGRLLAEPRRSDRASPISRFPSADMDLAFVVDDDVPAAEVQATLAAAGGALLAGIHLFDAYRGQQLGPGRRSLAYRLRFAALDHTLTDHELVELRDTCITAVEAAHCARLRV